MTRCPLRPEDHDESHARISAPVRLTSGTGTDAVVSHHMNHFRSGVARFNLMLAERLGVPRLSLTDPSVTELARPLLSFKVSELGDAERATLGLVLDAESARPSWFLHDYSDLPLEHRLLDKAEAVLCGNDAIRAQVTSRRPDALAAWTPGLLDDCRRFDPAIVTVFSFGMAHKIRTGAFRQLRVLLEDMCQSYAVHISSANHETTDIEDAQVVYDEMHELFPSRLYFLGNLSDVAVYNHLVTSTFFAAFFRGGVRANNTSVASAMEHGAVVISNLDEHSPTGLRHMDNMIDIGQCDALPTDPLVLRRISVRAMETARQHSWADLSGLVRRAVPT